MNPSAFGRWQLVGDELTGVTLGGFGGRSPSLPPPYRPSLPPSSSVSLSLSLPAFLHWRSVVSHAAAAAAVSEARTQLGVFENKFPLQLLLITVIIVIIWGLSRPVWGLRGWPDNEAASARGEDHSEHRPATNMQHSHRKAFIKIILYSKKAIH